jgi:hypothetical protein
MEHKGDSKGECEAELAIAGALRDGRRASRPLHRSLGTWWRDITKGAIPGPFLTLDEISMRLGDHQKLNKTLLGYFRLANSLELSSRRRGALTCPAGDVNSAALKDCTAADLPALQMWASCATTSESVSQLALESVVHRAKTLGSRYSFSSTDLLSRLHLRYTFTAAQKSERVPEQLLKFVQGVYGWPNCLCKVPGPGGETPPAVLFLYGSPGMLFVCLLSGLLSTSISICV